MKIDEAMTNEKFLTCPLCNNKTRTKAYPDTVLLNFPLFCPKCKRETVVNVKGFIVTIIKEPAAKTQSR